MPAGVDHHDVEDLAPKFDLSPGAESRFARVPRELFVPPEERDAADADAALPIGSGQTISQPYMVARICETLALRGDERVLDVAGGTGDIAARCRRPRR